jgi:hypothetical protein
MREQARKQIEWRLARRVAGSSPLQKSASFLRASTFDQNDLYSAAQEFEEEIDAFNSWLKEKGKGFRPSNQGAGFDNDFEAEWEEIATWWQKGPPPSSAVLSFFDDYVHDSRAWFKLNGDPDNEKDMHTVLGKWVERRKAAELQTARKASLPIVGGKADYTAVRANDGLSEDERRAADEYAKTGKIPRMATTGREPFGLGRAGYLRFRKIYGGWDSELLSAVPDKENEDVVLATANAHDQSSPASA